MKSYSLILAGGSGTRLWPVSRESFPKQFSSLIGQDSLIQLTYKRLAPVFSDENIFIVIGEAHRFEVLRHLMEYGSGIESRIITEPMGRNTAPAIMLGILNILKKEEDALIFVFPADHVIDGDTDFQHAVDLAESLSLGSYIVTFGIKPEYPETGYGYIHCGAPAGKDAYLIDGFTEKPERDEADKYIKSGEYYWNSGMFAFKASVVLEEFRRLAPEICEIFDDLDLGNINAAKYEMLPDISIDYSIMEKTDKGVVLPVNFRWSDVGSWKSVYDFFPKEKHNNVVQGDVITSDTENCFIKADNKLVVASGVSDIAIVDTDDALLISDINLTTEVKSIVGRLKESGRKEGVNHSTVYKPWGYYKDLLSMNGYKVKKIAVNPGCKLSLQKHRHRSEHWVVSKGTAKVINGDETLVLKETESVFIAKSNVHRIENIGEEELHIIEVQFGEILEEDDIERIEDDFGRK